MVDQSQILVAMASGMVYLVSLARGQIEAEYPANEDWLRRVLFHQESNVAFTTCQDGTATMINLETGQLSPVLADYRPTSSLTLHRDSLFIIDANGDVSVEKL